MIMTKLSPAIPMLFLATTSVAQAQLYPIEREARGGGTIQGCDSSLHVGFSSLIIDPFTYVFNAEVDSGITAVTGSLWSYYTTDFYQLLGEVDLQIAFPGSGDYPVCLTVNAIDPETQQPCSTTTCDLFQPLADSSCLSLVPDFTIAAVDGQTITFLDQSSFAAALEQLYWSFGDGAFTAQVSPSHTFSGPGPFEVCLTVIGPAPVYCSATVCKWLYLGPTGVDCSVVLDQGYLFLQQEDLVGVLDTSRTSGMNTAVTWDFGDGYIAVGNVAVHAYEAGSYDLCSTVRVWGPLTTDTCISTLCRTVEAYPVAVVDELSEGLLVNAWPNPFSDHLSLSGLEPGMVDIAIHDACGRLVHQAFARTDGPSLTLSLERLAPGAYTVRYAQDARMFIARALKQ